MYSLENITIESSVPPIVDENAFAKFQFSSVKLSVPEESIEVYKSEEVWGKFYTINGWVPANISILKSNDNKPIVVYTILLAFTAPWGDYMFASVIAAGDSSLFNVAVGLQQLLTKESGVSGFPIFCAAGVIVSIPIMTLFFFLQGYYVEGVTGGAVKG